MENLETFHLLFGGVPDFSSIQQDGEDSSPIDPDLGWSLYSSAIPNVLELMKGAISLLDTDIQVSVDCPIPTDSCTQVDKVANLLNGFTLNRQLNTIILDERSLGGALAYSHALGLLCIYSEPSVGAVMN